MINNVLIGIGMKSIMHPFPDIGPHIEETVDARAGRAGARVPAVEDGRIVDRRRLAAFFEAIRPFRTVARWIWIGSPLFEWRWRGGARVSVGGRNPFTFARQAFRGPPAIGLGLVEGDVNRRLVGTAGRSKGKGHVQPAFCPQPAA